MLDPPARTHYQPQVRPQRGGTGKTESRVAARIRRTRGFRSGPRHPAALDLPELVSSNAQTKVCFGPPDATAATMAARKLDSHNSQLPGQIRTLGVGEAYVSFAGRAPQLLRVAQAHRDAAGLGLPDLRHPQRAQPAGRQKDGRPATAQRTPAASGCSRASSAAVRARLQRQQSRDTTPELAVRRLLHAAGSALGSTPSSVKALRGEGLGIGGDSGRAD